MGVTSMTSNMRNLIIGGIVVVVIGVGVAVAAGGGDDSSDVGEVATTPIDGEEGATDGSGDGSSGGGSSSGGSSSGGSTGDGSGSSQGGDQDQGGDDGDGGGDEAPPPEATSAPTVNLISQDCLNQSQLRAVITANASSGYRKGVQSVTMSRKNDENADLTFNGAWYGPETGAGDQWHATLNYQNNFGKTLRVVAKSDSGQTTTKEYPITVNC